MPSRVSLKVVVVGLYFYNLETNNAQNGPAGVVKWYRLHLPPRRLELWSRDRIRPGYRMVALKQNAGKVIIDKFIVMK
jgi:hypothetical protein